MDIHRLQTSAKSLAFDLHVDKAVPPVLLGDPSRLKQVLINLISNAVKFTERGGITVSVTTAGEPAAKDGEVVLEFSVADTGIGIPADKQQDVFESFLQADETITRKHGGTGLGLAICKLLVELMHGRMHLVSTEGEGSTFSFTARLAIGDPAALPKPMPDAPPPAVGHLRVLLADDNALNRYLAKALLEQHGHDVTTVENGAQALEAVREESFDLVLMDVQMPVMDGITATRAIRDPNSGVLDPDLPIVAITAHALKGDRERFIEVGMNDYISKPVSMDAFYAAISRVMEGRPAPEARESAPVKVSGAPFEREEALARLGGRTDLLGRMDEFFVRDAPVDLEGVRENLAKEDFVEAKRLAHSIKGAARTIGAARVGSRAEQLEFFCGQKDGPSCDNKLKILELELREALEFLKKEKQA